MRSGRLSEQVVWSLWGLSIALAVISACLVALNWSTPLQESRPARGTSLLYVGLFLIVGLIGVLVVTRSPRHPVGWLLCGLGTCGGLSVVADGYAIYALITDPGSLPGGTVGAWLSTNLAGLLLFNAVIMLLLLFPDGRLLSSWWRWAVWANVVSAVLIGTSFLTPGVIQNFHDVTVTNPLGIEGTGGLLDVFESIGFGMSLAVAIGAVVSLVMRFRQARGTERQQLKWLLTAGAAFALIMFSGPLFWSGLLPVGAWPVVFALGLAALPVGIGIGILRHDLYDIDLIINRALVYLVLTATLALTYVLIVFSLGAALRAISGQSSAVVTAASTLAVAALFQPARRRIQRVVDRRFNRSRYDAARTLDDFSTRLRDEIDLTTLTTELQGLVNETMQPAHVSFWLRPRS